MQQKHAGPAVPRKMALGTSLDVRAPGNWTPMLTALGGSARLSRDSESRECARGAEAFEVPSAA